MGRIAVDWPEPRVALVTIDRPERRNALDDEMFERLAALWPELERSAARAVVVTGAGSAFCSGADLSIDFDAHPDLATLIDRALLKTVAFPKPLVAAVNGHAVAGGLELVLSADLRAVAEGARLAFPEVQRAIFPAGGAALKLAGEIGYAPAMDLLLTGRFFDAAEALRLGLVNQVLPAAEVLPWALDRAAAIARNSPVAVRAVKEFAVAARAAASAPLLALEERLWERVRRSRDAAEGRAAFREKRAPAWPDDEVG